MVVDEAGRPAGVIDHDALRGIAPDAVDRTPVSAVTVAAPEGWAVELVTGHEAVDLVTAFQESRGRVVAVTEGGALRGIVRVERVNAALGRN